MKVSTKLIEALKPCSERFNNYLQHYPNFNGSLADFLSLDNISYSDKVWVFINLATHIQNVKWSVACAGRVLSLYESYYPNDKRPRLALEAATAFVLNPTEENKNATSAARAAAANATSAAYAAYAARAAAANAANAAAYAATSAAYAATSAAAANAAYAAAYAATSAAAANAAYAAAYAATSAAANTEKQQEDLNLLLMLEAIV